MSETAAQTAAVRPARKKKRKIIRRIILLVIILLILGLTAFTLWQKLRAEYTVSYDPYTATTGSISNALNFSGSMQLVNTASYTAPGTAKVRAVYVSPGDLVKEGDKLMRLSDGTTVTADFDATVNTVSAAAGDEVSQGSALVQIADFDHMTVSFRIGESNINTVAVGQDVRVTVASASAVFESRIKSIDYASYSGNSVAYYTATVDVDTSAQAGIYPGMQATITIPQEEARDVVVLKMEAVSTARDNTAFVYKAAEDGTMTQTPVTVGVSNGNYVEIRSGVADGETVYAVSKEEETSTSIFASLFGTQQVNMPAGNPGSNRQNFGGGNNGGNPNRQNRGN